jgi:hypothetical protein
VRLRTGGEPDADRYPVARALPRELADVEQGRIEDGPDVAARRTGEHVDVPSLGEGADLAGDALVAAQLHRDGRPGVGTVEQRDGVTGDQPDVHRVDGVCGCGCTRGRRAQRRSEGDDERGDGRRDK